MKFTVSLATLLGVQLLLLLLLLVPQGEANHGWGNNNKYDFVIIGGGTAGCAVGGRLSENPDAKVLILEQAKDESDNPALVLDSINSLLTDTSLSYTPVDRIRATEPALGRGVDTLVPRALGGGPAVSGSAYTRNDPQSTDEWCTTYGATGFCYSDLLPYFQKQENYTSLFGNLPVHPSRGTDGPLQISDTNINNPGAAPYLEAFSNAFNTSVVADINTSQGMRFLGPFNRLLGHDVNNPQRSDSCKAYALKFLADRPNLEVMTFAKVKRIDIVDGKAKRVEYVTNDECRVVKVKKEVIVSAGAYRSPQILRLSGIGPRQELEDMGIIVHSDLPGVGANLQDHAFIQPAYVVIYPQANSPFAADAGAILGHWNNFTDPEFIDTEVAFTWIPTGNPTQALLFTNIISVRQESVGFSRLRTVSPFDEVYLRFGFARDHFRNVARAFRTMRKAFLEIFPVQTGQPVFEASPGTTVLPLDATEEQYLDWVGSNIGPYFHPSSTCRLGDPSDPNTVVDLSFKVKGVDNIRVVDASVFPRNVVSHPHATVLAMAEKCADIIKADHNL